MADLDITVIDFVLCLDPIAFDWVNEVGEVQIFVADDIVIVENSTLAPATTFTISVNDTATIAESISTYQIASNVILIDVNDSITTAEFIVFPFSKRFRVLLNEDIISNFSFDNSVGVEVLGEIPTRVGIDRIRIVKEGGVYTVKDLNNYTQMYVKYLEASGKYELHVKNVTGSQLVTMTYADRKNLKYSGGVISVKTATEIEDAVNTAEQKRQISTTSANIQANKDLSETVFQMLLMLFGTIVEIRSSNTDVQEWFDTFVDRVSAIFPTNVEVLFQNDMDELITNLQQYVNTKKFTANPNAILVDSVSVAESITALLYFSALVNDTVSIVEDVTIENTSLGGVEVNSVIAVVEDVTVSIV